MPEPMTLELVAEVLGRLMVALPRGRGSVPVLQLADVYRDHLHGISGDALRWATKQAIQDDSFFPKVARLRELAKRWETHNHSAVLGPRASDNHCARCGSAWEWVKFWRPLVTEKGWGKLVTSDGWLMLAQIERRVCPKCETLSPYFPDIEAPFAEAAMRLDALPKLVQQRATSESHRPPERTDE